MEHTHRYRLLRMVTIAVLSLALASCGFGDDDPDPTATSAAPEAQPTVAATEEDATARTDTADSAEVAESPVASPVNIDMSSPGAVGTPAVAEAATDAEPTTEPSVDAATATAGTTTDTDTATATDTAREEATDTDTTTASGVVGPGAGTPDGVAAGDESDADGEAGTDVEADPATPEDAGTDVGDGTTGAVSIDGTPIDSTGGVATPAADGTPAPGGTAVPAQGIRDVTSCDVTNIPSYTGEVTSFTLSEDVNFRSGPGTDCDQIGEGPLGAFTAVDVIGGPVVRTDADDDFEWVQVQVGDTTGWLVLEFLEPAE